jgi:hypothetical protein
MGSLSFLNDQGITLRRPSRADEDTNVITDAHPMSESEVLSALQVVLFTPLCVQNLFHLFTHVKKLHFKKSQKCEEFVAENITLKIVCLKIAGVVDRQMSILGNLQYDLKSCSTQIQQLFCKSHHENQNCIIIFHSPISTKWALQ